jgi:hypothetical protein
VGLVYSSSVHTSESIIGTLGSHMGFKSFARFQAASKAGRQSAEESNFDRAERLEIVASAAVFFAGSYWGFRAARISLMDSIALQRSWLWWGMGWVYFVFALWLITTLIFAIARRYTGFTSTATTRLSCWVHNLLAAVLMISAASTEDYAVRAALASIGFEHLSWLLLGTAFVVFFHMGSIIVLQRE